MYHDSSDSKGDRRRPPTPNDKAMAWPERQHVKPGRYVMFSGRLTHIDDLDAADAAGRTRQDDRPRRSMAMGCVDPVEQQTRIRRFERAGIRGCRYDVTGQLVFPRGFETQKRLAKMHGMDVGRM